MSKRAEYRLSGSIACALLIGAMAVTPEAALAQESRSSSGDQRATGSGILQIPDSASRIEDSALRIEDIVVSARRRTETLQETPVAISAITPSMLESRATLNIGDIQGSVPNLIITLQASGPSAANVSIRGLSFNDIDKSFEQTVGIVVDGVFVGTNTGILLDFFDIESLEVLRGPQGTLFGRNTIGGVINVRRTRPTGKFGGKFQLSYGSYNTITARGVMNFPISDGLAAKIFYSHAESDGYFTRFDTGKHAGGNNDHAFGVALLATPSDNFSALLTLEHQIQKFDPLDATLTKTGEAFCASMPVNECNRNNTTSIYTSFGQRGFSHYRAPAATLEMNLDLGATTLTSITGYRRSKEHQAQDFEGSSVDLYFGDRRQNFRQFSQELRAAGNFTDQLDYVLGGYFYSHRYDLLSVTRVGGVVTPGTDTFSIGHNQSYALFGDFNWRVLDKVRFSFGGRWTHDRKKNQLAAGPTAFPQATYSASKFTPKLSLDYRPSDGFMAYASWSKGYRAGGFSGRGLTALSSTTPYDAETVDSYEIGLKSSLFDRRMTVNLAAFTSKYSDMQQNTTIPAPGTQTGNETIVTNVGSSTIKGIEAELVAQPVGGLKLSATIAYLKSGFSGFITQGAISALVPGVRTIDYSNVNLAYAPKMTASVNAEYSADLGFADLKTNVGYRHISPFDTQVALDATAAYPATGVVIVDRNDPRVRTDKQNLVDASATLVFHRDNGSTVQLSAYGRNLLNDRGLSHAFTVAGLFSFATPRPPREYGVQLGVEF